MVIITLQSTKTQLSFVRMIKATFLISNTKGNKMFVKDYTSITRPNEIIIVQIGETDHIFRSYQLASEPDISDLKIGTITYDIMSINDIRNTQAYNNAPIPNLKTVIENEEQYICTVIVTY